MELSGLIVNAEVFVDMCLVVGVISFVAYIASVIGGRID